VETLEDRRLPSTITPTTFADGGLGSGSLRDAVLQFNGDAGTDDDTILLLAGTYSLTILNSGGHHETAGLTGDLNLTQTSHCWIIQGAGSSGDKATIIDAGQLQDRVFQIVNPGTQVVFQDLVIQGGLAQEDGTEGALAGSTDALGGGILNNGGNVTLDNVVVQKNVARGGDAASLGVRGHNALGGGFYSTGGALTLAGATIANNQASGGRGGDYVNRYTRAGDGGWAYGAGLYATGGSLGICNSTIGGNRATGGRRGDGSFSNSDENNGGSGGTGQGGGLYVDGGSLTLASSTIASNEGTGGTGGLYGRDGTGQGGGLYNNGTLTIGSSTLAGNSAAHGSGGGVYNRGTLTVNNSTLTDNSARAYNDYGGGGIFNNGKLVVSNSTLTGNSATAYDGYNTDISGGAVYNDYHGMLTLSSSTLAGNSATAASTFGGGIFNSGTLAVNDSSLSGNSVRSSFVSQGGGIANGGTLTVTNSTFSGNSANGYGGGIDNGGPLTVSETTFSGNSAAYGGGGILNQSTYPVTLTNVTLTSNRATTFHGGGLFVYSGSPVLHTTLIAGNFHGANGTTRDDVYGRLDPSGDYNLIGDGSGMTGLQNGVEGNQVGSASDPIDPLLDALRDNGGPTLTHALLAGSPALDAGNPNQLGVPDQRGVVRSGGVNIGAYQASASAFILDAPDTVQAGVPFDVTVTAVDPFRQVAVGYTGTVTFSTTDSDPGVVLPADYTFTLDDGGTHTFTDTGRGETTLLTLGDQMLTVTDTADSTITGSATITVVPAGAAPAPDFSQRPVGSATIRTATPVENVTSVSPNTAVERFFTALAEEESTFPWLRWELTEPGEPAACDIRLA
jgi:hypothetical protein